MRATFRDIQLDLDARELRRGGQLRPLEPKAFDILSYLLAERHRIVSKQEMLDRFWPGQFVGEGSLTQCIWTIRRALGETGSQHSIVKTFYGRGYRFVGEPSVVLPTPPAASRLSCFVGREREIDRFDAMIGAALGARTQLLLIEGEAGVGKTRLADELGERARAAGARVLWGRSYEGEGAPPFWPWVQILRAAVIDLDVNLSEAERRLAADVAQIVPEVRVLCPNADPVPRLEPQQERFRLFDSVARLLGVLASRDPLCLIFDDIHAADLESLLQLDLVAQVLPAARLACIATVRNGFLAPGDPRMPALDQVARRPSAVRSVLPRLTQSEVTAWLAETSGQVAPDPITREIFELTGGHPLFVAEVIEFLSSSGRLEQIAQGSAGTRQLPPQIRDMISLRLDRLSPACRDLLRGAAVAGFEFDVELLVRTGFGAPDDVAALLDEACRAHWLTRLSEPESGFRFSAGLVRETVYAELPAGRRTALHREFARELGVSGGGPSQIAHLAHHHWEAAPTGDARDAVEYSRQAGARAMQLFGHEAAVRHYERALEAHSRCATSDPVIECEIWLALGEARSRAGDRAESRAALLRAADLARRVGATGQLAEVALRITPSFTLVQTGEPDPVLEQLLEEVLEVAGDAPALRARVLSTLAMVSYWSRSRDDRRLLCDEARSLCARIEDDAVRVPIETAIEGALWSCDDVGERLRRCRDLVARADAIGDHARSLECRFRCISALLEQGDLAAADREAAAFATLAEKVRSPQSICYATRFRALRALIEGSLEKAERLSHEFVGMSQRMEPQNALHAFSAQLMTLRWHQGRTEELLPQLEARCGEASLPVWHSALAFYRVLAGRRAEAERDLARLLPNGEIGLRKDAHWYTVVTLLAETCFLLEDVPRARQLYELLLPHRKLCAVLYEVIYRGSVERYLGLLAMTQAAWDTAVEHLEHAVEIETRMGTRPWITLAQTGLARALLGRARAGDRERARAALADAGALAESLKMAALVREVAELVASAASGSPPRANASL